VIQEKVDQDNVDVVRKGLKKIKKDIADRDIKKFVQYLESTGMASEVLSGDVFVSLLTFGTEIGFPSTIGAARMALSADGLKTEDILDVLERAKIIDRVDIPGGTIESFVNRDWKEDKEIKKNPTKEIAVYDYNQMFVGKLGDIFNKIGFKGEDTMNPVLKTLLEESERVKQINSGKPLEEVHEDPDHSEEDELEFFHHLDNEALDKFADGLLLVLGELEASGKIPHFDSAKTAKTALMATIRKLYQSRSSIGKMARKYQRFGAQRVLRKARREITRAQSSR